MANLIYIIENKQESYLTDVYYDFDNFPTYQWTDDIRDAKFFLDKDTANNYRQKIIEGKKADSLDTNMPLGRISVGKYIFKKVK
jgi:hypothetical protein